MANSYEAVGTLHAVMDTQQVKDTFKKRDFVLEMADGNYPQHIKFQVTQDRCALLDTMKVGQQVKVLFNLRGRPFQNREGQTVYYTNLEAWRIEGASAAAPASTDYSQISPAQSGAKDDFDDVPF
jgi:spore germination protein YaaH